MNPWDILKIEIVAVYMTFDRTSCGILNSDSTLALECSTIW